MTHSLTVVRDRFGWSVCIGAGTTSPFRTRARAILEAERLCHELRRHGEIAEFVVAGSNEAGSAGGAEQSRPKRPSPKGRGQ